MTTVHDIARYIMDNLAQSRDGESITAWKLQKLVYYAQAWSLVWDERPLFDAEIQAWADGPVCPELYTQHRGRFKIRADDISGDPAALDAAAIETVDAVLKHYGDRPAKYLSDLTHQERPWREARGDTPPGQRSTAPITHEAMAEYYASL